jgi:hypothetical protein
MIGKRVLMVEGSDDEHVVKNFCGEHKIGKIDDIRNCGGKDPLLDNLAVQLKESDLIALGILLDADIDPQATWNKISSRLQQAGYTNIPDSPEPHGTVISAPVKSILPRVGIWMMPDNEGVGILEDFLQSLIPAGDSLFAHVQNSIETIPSGQLRFEESKKPKALMHTWLAWQEEPGKPLGLAIKARYLDPHTPTAITFVNWLQQTFFAP